MKTPRPRQIAGIGLGLWGAGTGAWLFLVTVPESGVRLGSSEFVYPGQPRITALRRMGPDSVGIVISNVRATDSIRTSLDSTWRAAALTGPATFRIRLRRETTTVDLSLARRPTLGRLVFVFDPPEVYAQANLRGAPAGTVNLVRSDLAVGSDDQTTIAEWLPPAPVGSLPDGLDATASASTTWGRLEPTVRHYATWLDGRRGVPNDALQSARPIEALQMLAAPGGRGWCYNFSVGFLAIARDADVPARLVAMHALRFTDVWLGNHAMNEVWDAEWRRWRLIDFTLGVLAVTLADGTPLSVAELHSAMAGDAPSDELRFLYHTIGAGAAWVRWSELQPQTRDFIRLFYGPRQQMTLVRRPSTSGDLARRSAWMRLLPGRERVLLVDAPVGARVVSLFQLRALCIAIAVFGSMLCATALGVRLIQRRRAAP